MSNHPSYIGVVVAAGRCLNSVKVRVAKRVWHRKLRKNYVDYTHHLCDDYLRTCVAGDIVRIAAGYPSSAQKSHIVDALVSPMRTGTERVQPEGVEGWLRRRQEKRRKKLLRLPGVEEADNPVPVPQSEAEEKLLRDDNAVPAPQTETKGAENPVPVPQSEAAEGEGEEKEEMPAARRRAASKAWGIFGEVLLGKRVGVRVCEDGRKLVNGSRAGPAVVPAGEWKFLWKGLEERKRLKAASRAASKAQAEKDGREFDEQQWEEEWRDRKRKGPAVTAVKKGKNKDARKQLA